MTPPEPAVRLLLVEDDASIGEPLVEALTREGYEVTWVQTGNAALTAEAADLVLLDLGLPDLDGREVCRRLHAEQATPIIILTARDDELERVLLLESGADDYIVKPFGFRELVARIRAVRRRIGATPAVAAADPAPAAVADSTLTVDTRSRRVLLAGVEIDLTPKEFDLLSLLTAEQGRVLTREEIIERVWDVNWWGPTKTLDVHVAALRKKLGDPRWITTLRGVGYRFDPPPDLTGRPPAP